MLIGACSLNCQLDFHGFPLFAINYLLNEFCTKFYQDKHLSQPVQYMFVFFGKYPLTKPIFMTPDVDSAKKLPQILSVCPFSGSALFQLIIISSRVSRWMSSFLVVIISKLPGKSLNVKGHKEKRQQPQTHTHKIGTHSIHVRYILTYIYHKTINHM